MGKNSRWFGVWVGILSGVLGLIHPVQAVPTLYGPTGLISVGSAEILGQKQVAIGYALISSQDYRYSITLGAFKNWEFGFTGGAVPTEGVFIHAKYGFSDNEPFPLQVGIGIENFPSKTDCKATLVLTKIFTPDWQGTFGYQSMFNHGVIGGMVIGLSYQVNPALMVVVDGRQDQDGFHSDVGIRIPSVNLAGLDLVVALSATRIGDPGGANASLGISTVRSF